MSTTNTANKMKYVNLGKSGLKVRACSLPRPSGLADDLQVSKLILGVMTYGSGQDWMISDHDEGIRQMK
jgi:aryl-alcohol dehydrogenase-like predicted oxidoreductase